MPLKMKELPEAERPYEKLKMYGEDNVIVDADFDGQIKPCFNIGKYRNVSVEYVAKYDQKYLQWCISDKCNFMDSTKKYIGMDNNLLESGCFVREESTNNRINTIDAKVCMMGIIKENLDNNLIRCNSLMLL